GSAIPYFLGSAFPRFLAVGEFNSDGKADLAVGSSSSPTSPLSIFLGGATPDLTITSNHGGGFTQGQIGAAYNVTVSNIGEIASSGAIGVVLTLPASGFTLTAVGGAGWTCASLACTRSDSLAVGASYPTITVTLNIAANASGNATSTFTVSGGGDQS